MVHHGFPSYLFLEGTTFLNILHLIFTQFTDNKW